MAKTHRSVGRDRHVEGKLEHRDDRIPSQLRRNVRATRWSHPGRTLICIAVVEQHDRVARILQIDHAHRPPWGVSRHRRAVLVHEPHETAVTKFRQPGWRAFVAILGDGTPDAALEWRPAPQRARNRITDRLEQLRRFLRVHGAKAEAMQIQSGPLVLRQRAPIAVNFREQGARGGCAIFGLKQQRQWTVEIGILNRNTRNVAMKEIFDRIHCCRIDPSGAGRRDHDEGGAIKAALALEFFQR